MEKADKKKQDRWFRLSLVDVSTHERLWSLRYSRRAAVIASVSAVVIVVVLLFSLIAYTPIRVLIPGYPSAQSRRQAVQNALRIDSLQTRIVQWELYAENLRRVVAGQEPIRLDNLAAGASQDAAADIDAAYLALRDSLLRADVQAQEQFGVGSEASTRRNLPIEALSFFTPVKGVVSKGFERALHPWVDVTAPAGSVVMSVLDGTVVYTGWEEGSGYVMVIQHRSDLLSLYKNNEKLLRKAGDAVKAGTPVGVLASSASLTKGDHLHFELWYEGAVVDPAQFIKF